MERTMRSGRRTRELEDRVSIEAGEDDMEYVDDFFLSSGDKHPSLMELPFAIQEIQWDRTQAEKVSIRGKTGNGLDDVMCEIDLWRLELPLEGKPRFLVHKVSGPWMQLRKPHDIYLETMKVVLVAAHFLTFAKQCPNASKGAVWRYVRKECSSFKAKANDKDLAQAFLLLQSIVKSDAKLEASPMIQKFFPTLFKKSGSQAETGAELNGKEVRVKIMKRENSSPVRETNLSERGSSKRIFPGVENSGIVGDHVKGESSTQSRQRMRNLDSFAVELDLPLSKRLNAASTKKKSGRPGRTRKKGKQKPQPSGNKREGDDEWVDEPDVCSFCDDGVEGGEKLLCCDGECMRSFHPTIDSGWANECPSLGLTRAAVSDESYICPNCAHKQHQCFSCGKLGSSCNSEHLQEVFVCGARACRRFYHPNCVAKLLVPELAHHALASRIQLGQETFYCPLHKCASCKLEEDKTDPEQRLIKCRRCPVAWHRKCLPRECEEHLWSVDCGNFVMYCGKHKVDPKLLTPKRDHVTFPKPIWSSEATPSSSGSVLSSVNGCWSSCNVPLPGNFGEGPHDVRAYERLCRVCEIITESQESVTLDKIRRTVKPAPPCQNQACSQPRDERYFHALIKLLIISPDRSVRAYDHLSDNSMRSSHSLLADISSCISFRAQSNT